MSRTVYIFGDSWGCGQWDTINGKYQVTHKGLEKFFTDDNYTVKNFSVPGNSNSISINALKTHIKNITQQDLVLIIQTDPIRNLRPYITINDKLKQTGSYNGLHDQLLEKDYVELNNIAEEHNLVLHLIGGCSNLLISRQHHYKNLNFLIPSWINILADYRYHKIKNESFKLLQAELDIGHLKKEILGSKLYKNIILEMAEAFDNCSEVFCNELFHPDGTHPNCDGHKILYNKIKELLNL